MCVMIDFNFHNYHLSNIISSVVPYIPILLCDHLFEKNNQRICYTTQNICCLSYGKGTLCFSYNFICSLISFITVRIVTLHLPFMTSPKFPFTDMIHVGFKTFLGYILLYRKDMGAVYGKFNLLNESGNSFNSFKLTIGLCCI